MGLLLGDRHGVKHLEYNRTKRSRPLTARHLGPRGGSSTSGWTFAGSSPQATLNDTPASTFSAFLLFLIVFYFPPSYPPV